MLNIRRKVKNVKTILKMSAQSSNRRKSSPFQADMIEIHVYTPTFWRESYLKKRVWISTVILLEQRKMETKPQKHILPMIERRTCIKFFKQKYWCVQFHDEGYRFFLHYLDQHFNTVLEKFYFFNWPILNEYMDLSFKYYFKASYKICNEIVIYFTWEKSIRF